MDTNIRLLPEVDAEDNHGTHARACIEVGGVQVYAYTEDGALVVSVDFGGADPEVFDLRADTVPVTVLFNGEKVYSDS